MNGKQDPAAQAPAAEPSRITVSAVLNVQSGSLKRRDIGALANSLTAALNGSRFSLLSIDTSGRPIQSTLEAAVAEGGDCLLIGGGDGSVSAAAALAWKHDRLLAVLPGGTMNLFARTLGLPDDIDETIDALATAKETTMDIATANGTPFIHQYTVGLHADAIRLREGMSALIERGRPGKLLASARAFLSVVLDPPRFPVLLRIDGRRDDPPEGRTQRLSALSVSNNPFGTGHLPYADSPDAGTLGVYLASPLRPWSAARLVADIVLGTYRDNTHVAARTARRVELDFPARWLSRHARRRALRDGELIALEPTVRIEIHPRAVRVLRPAAAA